MADFSVNTERILASSEEFARLAARMKRISTDAGRVSLAGVLENRYRREFQQAIQRMSERALRDAAKMDSFSAALASIAKEYRGIENKLTGVARGSDSSSQRGADKRNIIQKLWDWFTGQEPDQYDTTTLEQEKAADEAMRNELRNILQDEKYSQEHWENASIEERKQILQDYMDEVMAVYGLKHVKNTIHWDNTLKNNEWGCYTNVLHRVTINENLLLNDSDAYRRELLNTVSHELRHAYQHEAVSHPTDFMVSKETIDEWRDNFKFGHYIRYENDPDGYYAQPVEADARSLEVL